MTRSSVASEVRSVVSSSQLPEAPPLGATLLIIDPGVPDYTRIMAAATPGTEVYLLDDQADSITQITEILAGRRNIHSLHILSHGSPNYLHFSGGEVGLHNIRTYAHLWPTWKNALTPESNILLYGCQVAAQTSEALSLVAHIAEQTGAKVAASSRPTGNAALGGDWQMDISTGPITAYPALQPFLLVTYPHLLGEAFFKLSDFTLPTYDSSPHHFTNLNDTLYFTAINPITGYELWRSDGTAAGTVLVKDLLPGSTSSELNNFTNLSGTLYFTAIHPTNGYELWRSDGTEAGTVLFKDIAPGRSSSYFNEFTNFNGALFFTAYNPTTGEELWKSDGTEVGTVIVRDIAPGYSGSDPATSITSTVRSFSQPTTASMAVNYGGVTAPLPEPCWSQISLLAAAVPTPTTSLTSTARTFSQPTTVSMAVSYGGVMAPLPEPCWSRISPLVTAVPTPTTSLTSTARFFYRQRRYPWP